MACDQFKGCIAMNTLQNNRGCRFVTPNFLNHNIMINLLTIFLFFFVGRGEKNPFIDYLSQCVNALPG